MHSEFDDLLREPGSLDTDAVTVRTLLSDDLAALVHIDRKVVGRSRREYLSRKLEASLRDSSVCISLAALVDGQVAGFLLGALYYGEFGLPEPVAILDTIEVDPGLRHRRVGSALLHQLTLNLRALGIERVQTEVAWTQLDLLGFFARRGFAPAPRFCLELCLGASSSESRS
jgi:N-acetylglutamate synthase-like GNAT family acetyltransferase